MSNAFQELCWLHAAFRIPADWEITAYSIEARTGRLEFSTRHGIQGVFSWDPCDAQPGRDALVAALPVTADRKAKAAPRPADIQIRDVGRFVLGWGSGDQPCQAAGYFESARKLVRWIFPAASPAVLEDVVKPVLTSVRENTGPARRYCAFGLDFRLPDAYRIESMHASPADVEMTFESEQKARLTVHRWGLPGVLLRDRSLEAFYAAVLRSRGATVRRVATRPAASALPETVEVAYEQTGEHRMDKFMGRPWTNGEGRIWHDRTRKRLFAIEQIGPVNVPLLPLASIWAGSSLSDLDHSMAQPVVSHADSPGRAGFIPAIAGIKPALPCGNALEDAPPGRNHGQARTGCESSTKRERLKWERQLASIPVRNTGVKTLAGAGGAPPLLEVELRYSGWLVPLSRLLRLRRRRRIQLDSVGWAVYERIDGRKTFEQIIDDFAAEHALTFLESRALLLVHLRNLMEAGLVVIGIR